MPSSLDFTRRLPLAACAAVAWLLAGCGTLPGSQPPTAPVVSAAPPVVLPPPAPTPPPPDPQVQADAAARRLLAYSDRLRELPAGEWPKEQARLDALRSSSEATDPAESAAASLELALLLAQTRNNGDLARALSLADNAAKPTAPPRWQSLARLLQTRLAEQRRLEEQAERQAQQLKDQQRRIEQLGSQLEALKAIERSLSARPVPPPPPAASTPAPPAAKPAP